MEKQNVVKIVEVLLTDLKVEEQKAVLLECASKIGTEEWQKDVLEWMKRLKGL